MINTVLKDIGAEYLVVIKYRQHIAIKVTGQMSAQILNRLPVFMDINSAGYGWI
jgi:hypothetical protein